MNRRSFLGLGLRCAVLGAALSSGLAVTRIKQINEYAVLYSFTDKASSLCEDEIPAAVKEQAFERMHLIAEAKQGIIAGHRIVAIPPGQKDKSDPMGVYGYYGITFDLEEAADAA